MAVISVETRVFSASVRHVESGVGPGNEVDKNLCPNTKCHITATYIQWLVRFCQREHKMTSSGFSSTHPPSPPHTPIFPHPSYFLFFFVFSEDFTYQKFDFFISFSFHFNIQAAVFSPGWDLPVNKKHISHLMSFKMIVKLLIHFSQQQLNMFWRWKWNIFTW